MFSFPLISHRGKHRPFVYTCHLLCDPSVGRIYISFLPVSLDWYAYHSPSGENVASHSSNVDVKSGVYFFSARSYIPTSHFCAPCVLIERSNFFPSRETSVT